MSWHDLKAFKAYSIVLLAFEQMKSLEACGELLKYFKLQRTLHNFHNYPHDIRWQNSSWRKQCLNSRSSMIDITYKQLKTFTLPHSTRRKSLICLHFALYDMCLLCAFQFILYVSKLVEIILIIKKKSEEQFND